MNNERKPLAQRREELVALCAQQRGELALEIAELRSPLDHGGVRGYLMGHKKSTLAIAGVVLGIVATQPKRALKLAAAGLSAWKVAQKVLPMIAAARSGQLGT